MNGSDTKLEKTSSKTLLSSISFNAPQFLFFSQKIRFSPSFFESGIEYKKYSPAAIKQIDAIKRKTFVQELQKVFSDYRQKTYDKNSNGKNKIKVIDIINFNNLVLAHFENSIKN